MVNYQKLYAVLFNAITDAMDIIINEPEKARIMLAEAQQTTEEMYIKSDDGK